MQVIPYVGDSSDGTTIFVYHFMNIIFAVVLEILSKNLKNFNIKINFQDHLKFGLMKKGNFSK